MERRSDDIFRVHDLSVLKSPMPAHLMKPSSSSSPTPVRPIPKQNVSPFGLSALAANMINRTPTTKSQTTEGKVGWSPLGTGSEQSLDLAHSAVKANENATPKFETPPFKMTSGSSLPTVGQAIQAALVETSPLQGAKGVAHDSMELGKMGTLGTLGEEGIVNNSMELDKAGMLGEEESAHSLMQSNEAGVTRQEKAVQDSMEVDKAGTLGEEESAHSSMQLDEARITWQEKTVQDPMQSSEAKILRQDKTAQDSIKLNKSPKQTLESAVASKVVPGQKRKIKSNLALATETVEQVIKPTAKPAIEPIVEAAVEPTTKCTVEQPAKQPAKHTVKSVTTGSEITLLKWSMVVVPNNPNVTKLEKLVTENWIVLVGRRADMAELWHSSLITNRLSNREITTGSGRIYKLEGPCDELAMIESGFNFDAIEAFREGFPENWQMMLIQELDAASKDRGKKPDARDNGRTTKLETIGDNQGKKQNVKDDDFENQCPTVNRLKTNDRRKSMPGPKPKNASNIKSPQESTLITPKIRKTATSNHAVSPKKSRRYSEPLSRWNDLPSFSCNVQVTGQTRSGRRVISPLPYWENQYFRSYGASPSMERRKDLRD